MTKETKSEIMDGVDGVVESKVVANNTVRYTKANGDVALRLHHTDVVTRRKDGKIVLDSGGWLTPTTKDRINGEIREHGFNISQKSKRWYLTDAKGAVSLFYDGMVVDPRTGIEKPKDKDEKQDRLHKLIDAYTDKIKAMDTLPVPNGGDCWDCSFRDVNTGKPMGDIRGDKSHLMSHLKEGYVHGSLIMNALIAKGYVNPALIFEMNKKKGDRDDVVRAVRHYFRAELGLVR